MVRATTEQRKMIRSLPEFTMAIDPGDTCGFCVTFNLPPDPTYAELDGYYDASSMPINEFLSYLQDSIRANPVKLVILEEYRIFPDKAMIHSGKTIPTAEYIGAIKWICAMASKPVQLIEQPARIKLPMAAVLKGRGFKSIGRDRHAKDAELHMWYYATRAERQQQAEVAWAAEQPF